MDPMLLRILGALSGPKPGPAGQGTRILRPPQLDDESLDPAVRAGVWDAYTAALTDKPSSTWSEAEKADINTQIQKVLKDSGFGS
jgi:hypothetical protein